MHCAQCSEKILDRPVIGGTDSFCSVECANLAAGLDPGEQIDYDDEKPLEGFIEDEE